MATQTRAELISLIAGQLGVKAQGQNVSGGDAALIGKALDSLLDDLRPSGAVTFATSAIPEWAQWHLIEMAAFLVAPQFGRPQNEAAYNRARAGFIGGAHTARQKKPAKGRFY